MQILSATHLKAQSPIKNEFKLIKAISLEFLNYQSQVSERKNHGKSKRWREQKEKLIALKGGNRLN